jgi:hypothetical protein
MEARLHCIAKGQDDFKQLPSELSREWRIGPVRHWTDWREKVIQYE